MEFYTVFSEPRPIRLCEQTRRFAWESLHGKYGDEAVKAWAVTADDIPGFAEMDEADQYDACIAKIAAEAPLRICSAEQVSGAATLGMAILEKVPVTLHGEFLWNSVSHLTLNFGRVLTEGIGGIEAALDTRLADDQLTVDQKRTLLGMKHSIDALRVWHKRYLDACKTEKPEVYALLQRVPFSPAQSFREAVQSLWFTFAFTRLCGNWPGIGRIDEMLGGYLKKDLEKGVITLDEAREFLASFFIKGCEWIQSDTPPGTGDAQHYQNIILGGIDVVGNDVTNEVTYLVLDIVEELAISDFPITIRFSKHSPERLFRRAAEVMRHGGGVVAVYNEELIIDSMVGFGYSPEEARRFANDGCWEVQVPGKTCFSYAAFDGLQILLHDTLRLDTESPASFESYDALYAAFHDSLEQFLERLHHDIVAAKIKDGSWIKSIPCPMISLLTDGCIESARSYFEGGPVYTVVSPHIGGAPDVGNSLYAIDRLVFQEKKISFDDLMRTLQANWEGQELLRQYANNRLTYYGNDCDEADRYTVRVLNDFAQIALQKNEGSPILFPPGVSTFGRQIEWAPMREAVPFGRKKGEILSGNTSPTPGTDTEGATAVIRSYCKTDLIKQTCGAALDVKLCPDTVTGADGVAALVGLIRGFLELGGFFMQLDIADAEVLRRAQEDPEAYKTLSVRVSGWNARFVTLNREWQQMIIERTAGKI